MVVSIPLSQTNTLLPCFANISLKKIHILKRVKVICSRNFHLRFFLRTSMANTSLLPLFLFERRSESFSDRWRSFCIRKKRSRSGRDCRFFTFVHLFRRFFSIGYWEKSIDFALSCKFQPRFHFNSPLLHGLFFTATIAPLIPPTSFLSAYFIDLPEPRSF